jgi:ketosteroid isomerase-like protein
MAEKLRSDAKIAFFTAKGAKIALENTEKWSKMAENGSKMAQNGSKMAEMGDFSAAIAENLAKISEKGGKNAKEASELLRFFSPVQ